MRPVSPRYPVDRYLVENSKNFEMVNIIDDDLWSVEPALRPEDELVLRKLHEMLQVTADDLKMLSEELAQSREPKVKTQPIPLDEEFNEKVHIDEIVDAKFHGHAIVDKPAPKTNAKDVIDKIKFAASNLMKAQKCDNKKNNALLRVMKPVKRRDLGKSKTTLVEICGNVKQDLKTSKLNNEKTVNKKATVAYNEITFKHEEPKLKTHRQNNFQIQNMPIINIRSELKTQNVLQLDIIPESIDKDQNTQIKKNVAVISIKHSVSPHPKPYSEVRFENFPGSHDTFRQPVRKFLKMSTCESSASSNNVSSDTKQKLKTHKQIQSVLRSSPKLSNRDRSKNKKTNLTKDSEYRTHLSLDEWKRKLNSVYGQPSTSKKLKATSKLKQTIPGKIYNTSCVDKPLKKSMNNVDYVPYSKLTLGGVRVSDIEREMSYCIKNDMPLSPVIDKILSSKENSPRKNNKPKSPRTLTTSDENLLAEVLDIEMSVHKTLFRNQKKKDNTITVHEKKGTSESDINEKNNSYPDQFESKNKEKRGYENTVAAQLQKRTNESDINEENNSYPDDFEEEKSKRPDTSDDENQDISSEPSKLNELSSDGSDNNDCTKHPNAANSNQHNTTYTKASNLSFKTTVDVFEFVHSVDTQDSGTQSNTANVNCLKESQTSPINGRPANPVIQPIHNDLWSSIDPKGDVEHMFKLEKELIKKIILEEYSDLVEKSIAKPSTSNDNTDNIQRNVPASQKNTQTSPAHVKCVMTSPTRTKTRTTSPFISVTMDRQTSPIVIVTNEEEIELKVELDNKEDSISINLSSPRFSLRLPKSSQEVLSNLENCSNSSVVNINDRNVKRKAKTLRKPTVSSSSSLDGDRSSSELSSLGEVRMRKRPEKNTSLSSSSTSVFQSNSDYLPGEILPLRSEGEVSVLGQSRRLNTNLSRSDGEMKWY